MNKKFTLFVESNNFLFICQLNGISNNIFQLNENFDYFSEFGIIDDYYQKKIFIDDYYLINLINSQLFFKIFK